MNQSVKAFVSKLFPAFSRISARFGARALRVILLVGLVHGLLYVFGVPPWQHYDEPSHFEYAWLIAHRPTVPQKGESDPGLSRQVMTSMVEHGFFYGMGFSIDPTQAISIGGYPKVGDPPLYYLFISLPLRVLGNADISWQLYAARLMSLALFLLTLVAAWGSVAEFAPAGHPLRWMVPATLALLPSYVDLMTAVNSDVGSAAVFSLFLWACVRLIRRGFSWFGLAASGITAGLCYLTKSTGYLALPLLALALVFTLWRGRFRLVAWGLLGVGVAVAALATLTWRDAAFWHTSMVGEEPTRVSTTKSAPGAFAFQISVPPNSNALQLKQPLTRETIQRISDKTVMLGAWMWATRPMRVRTLSLYVIDEDQSFFGETEIGTEPQFVAIQIPPVGKISRAWVSLAPLAAATAEAVTVYYSMPLLVEGARPHAEEPLLADAGGKTGNWGEERFVNLLRNASAEETWLQFQPWVDRMGERYIPDRGRPSQMLAAILDWQGLALYFDAASENLLETFWARFGWGHVPLLAMGLYSYLGVVTFLGILGVLIVFATRWRSLPWDVVVVMGLALAGVWGLALLRGAIYVLVENYLGFTPSARYAFPAIIPTVLLLNVGWYALLGRAGRWLRIPMQVQALMFVVLLACLDLIAISSLLLFYAGRR